MGNARSSSDTDSDRRCDEFYDYDSDYSNKSARFRSLPAKKPRLELKYNEEDIDNYEDTEICKLYYDSRSYGISIRACDWSIFDFANSDMFNKKGFVRSKVFRAGDCNEFQFYFVLEKLEKTNETHFGVYVCLLTNDRYEVTIKFKSYLLDYRCRKLKLVFLRKEKFPQKPGFRFLGSMCKETIMGDEESTYRYVSDDSLNLRFKINIHFKRIFPDTLCKLLEDNKEKDITLVVKGEEFPANRAILTARSPTFAKLLDKNKKATRLEIKDVDPDIMKQLLLFMYTGYVTKLFTFTNKLSIAADKYKLKDLKAMCKKVC